ncbi:MAG: acyl carrier protein [Alphaproteobacteria bacterium]|nr:acyl carrier protein [Alphaproteobacteria bacterium]MCB9928210.1 acyl carrier protein [Alphaproteobacteria bacterium]
MTEAEIKAILIGEITAIAPDIDPSSIPPDEDVREALDLDSMDMLNIIAALHERLGIDIPEADAPRFFTVNGGVRYIAERLG